MHVLILMVKYNTYDRHQKFVIMKINSYKIISYQHPSTSYH